MMELKLQTTEQDVKLLGELLMREIEVTYDIFPDDELPEHWGDFSMLNRLVDELVGQGLIQEWDTQTYLAGRKYYRTQVGK